MIANMRYIVTALVLGAGLAWLVLYAAGNDGYYRNSDVSRWEHASKGSAATLVVVTLAVVGATTIGLLLAALSPAARLRRLVWPAAAASPLLLLAAMLFLSIGH